jgi:hypothetical protein
MKNALTFRDYGDTSPFSKRGHVRALQNNSYPIPPEFFIDGYSRADKLSASVANNFSERK